MRLFCYILNGSGYEGALVTSKGQKLIRLLWVIWELSAFALFNEYVIVSRVNYQGQNIFFSNFEIEIIKYEKSFLKKKKKCFAYISMKTFWSLFIRIGSEQNNL